MASKKILKSINKELLGDFKKIDHISYNYNYYGYSNKFSKNIFIKVFTNDNSFKFYREKEIQIKYTKLYIYDFEVSEYKFLVLEYKEYIDIKELNDNNIALIANKIASFHNENLYEEENNDNIKDKIYKTLNKLKIRNDYEYFKVIINEFEEFFDIINYEYKLIGRVNIHGDFSTRNIKLCNDKLELIDFERSRKNNYYLDFIKFFYIDLKNDKNKIKLFLDEYYREAKLKKISELLKYALTLYTALGIMKYTSEIKDDEFEKIGFLMLEDIKNYIYKG